MAVPQYKYTHSAARLIWVVWSVPPLWLCRNISQYFHPSAHCVKLRSRSNADGFDCIQDLEGEISKELDQARQYFSDYERQIKSGPLKWLPFKIQGLN